jgi:hypothetical protein
MTKLTYNDVRWMLDDQYAKRAGPLRWLVKSVYVTVPNSAVGAAETTKTLQELWQVGADEYEWRDIDEVEDVV